MMFPSELRAFHAVAQSGSIRKAETLTERRAELRLSNRANPLSNPPDRNVLINHRHPDGPRIRISRIVSFELDPRLFQP
jgi:hypothetical protein